jgi:hypothetical protein
MDMKVEKREKPKPVKKSVKVAEALVVDVVREGDEFRVEVEGRVAGRISGTFRDVCFFVDEYRVCFNRSELVDLLKG